LLVPDRAALAVAVARDLGLPSRERHVVRSGGLTTIVAVDGLIARVSPAAFAVKDAVALATHAATRGGPVVPPTNVLDPGPHERDGMVISFWERVAHPRAVDPGVAGRALRELHESLEDCTLPLADFAHPREALRRLASVRETPDHELLREALALPQSGGQALHGDAAVSNCVGDGRWLDFDFAGRGPREADVATLMMRDLVHRRNDESARALAAYGPYDRDLAYLYLRGFVALTCVLLLDQSASQRPLAQLLAERLAWLRATR
jgi:Phosphotransferase enzyme family